MKRTWLTGVILLWSCSASADERCPTAALTDLERAYCTVVSKGEGSGLPGFEDFRRNDAVVQALLLKRPAERLGLKLPDAGARPATATAPPARPASPPARSASSPVRPESPSVHQASLPSTSASSGLSGCRLAGQGEVIVCADSRFILAANEQNSTLAPGVLEDGNRLGLPSYQGRRSDDDAIIRHLSDAYAVYLAKMLEIGLGAATLSFTEFHHAFHTTEAAGIDFARRAEQTFQRLKTDRKTMAVQSRLHDDLPASIDACMDISRKIIVCDNVGTNWVYVRPSNR